MTDADYAWFEEHPGIWVWEESGHILGFSASDTRDGTIWALFVDPACERRGIGRALLAAACETLRCAGHRTAMLTTDWAPEQSDSIEPPAGRSSAPAPEAN